MADISKIKLPSGDVYNLKDTSATHGMFFASYGYTTYAQVLFEPSHILRNPL